MHTKSKDDIFCLESLKVKLSVIIPTLNSPKSLDSLLSSLSQLQGAKVNLQVICVNNLTSKFRPTSLEKWSRSFLDFKYINSGTIGANIARNIGVRYSSGEILWFLDDDCFVTNPEILNTLIDLHKTYEEIDGIGGYYETSNQNISDSSFIYNLLSSYWLEESFQNPNKHTQLIGGNASYKRRIFQQGLFFDPRIKYGGTEEGLNKTLNILGKKLILTDKINILHYTKLNILNLLYKAYKQGQGKASNIIHLDIEEEKTIYPKDLFKDLSLSKKLHLVFFNRSFSLGYQLSYYSKKNKNILYSPFLFLIILENIFFLGHISRLTSIALWYILEPLHKIKRRIWKIKLPFHFLKMNKWKLKIPAHFMTQVFHFIKKYKWKIKIPIYFLIASFHCVKKNAWKIKFPFYKIYFVLKYHIETYILRKK